MDLRLQSYAEFWPFYVAQHLDPVNRALHVAGTAAVLGLLAGGVLVAPHLALWAPLAGYGPAWLGHFVFEKNRPATFRYPLWSLRGDFRMFFTTLAGRMGAELERARRLYPVGA